MDSINRSAVTPKKSRLARTFAKVLHIRAVTGISAVNKIPKLRKQEKVKGDSSGGNRLTSVSQSFKEQDNEEKISNKAAMEATLAKLFASVSTIKAAYAQLQISQSPYDAGGIQSSDQIVVSELQTLSELKQCHMKKQFDSSPETTMILAEIKEQKSLLKTYEIMGKKLESQIKLKDSEITLLRGKKAELNKQNRSIEKKSSSSSQLSSPDNIPLSGINPSNFITALKITIKSIRSFVRVMVSNMQSASWDIDAAVTAIMPGVVYWKESDKCFAFESFVCCEMFESFSHPNFTVPNESLPEQSRRKHTFFDHFVQLKSIKGTEFLAQNPNSSFAQFVRYKYLQLVHSKMEQSFFGDLRHRNLIKAGQFPDYPFFASFFEMAKRVWLLHCLAFSLEPEASVFQVSKNCRFSEVYMESVADEAFMSSKLDPKVAFTVVPGFQIGKTIVQCHVYLSKRQ